MIFLPFECVLICVYETGRTSAFQADYVGSIPITRSIRLGDRLRSIFLLSKYPQLCTVGIFIYSNNSKLLINSFLDSYNNSVLLESISYVYIP